MVRKAKITIKTKDMTQKENNLININDNEYRYSEKDNTKVMLNIKKNTLTRSNADLYMKYTFDKENITIGKVKIKSLNKTIEVKIITEEIIKKDNYIEISYKLEKDNYNYKIEME